MRGQHKLLQHRATVITWLLYLSSVDNIMLIMAGCWCRGMKTLLLFSPPFFSHISKAKQLQSTKAVRRRHECNNQPRPKLLLVGMWWLHPFILCTPYSLMIFWWEMQTLGGVTPAETCPLHQLQQRPTEPAASAAVWFSWACTVGPASPPAPELLVNYWDTGTHARGKISRKEREWVRWHVERCCRYTAPPPLPNTGTVWVGVL